MRMSLEYSREDNIWRSPPSPKLRTMKTCRQVPRRSSTMAVIILGLAILSCLLGYCVLSETLPYDSKSLRLVIILFRHGARSPSGTYNADPHKNYPWPDGYGQLTKAGKLQMYELGKKFRTHYGNFIPEEYLEKDVYIQSSDHSRCLMSAYLFLAGMFIPNERQTWHPDIPWQPIPVHSVPRNMDKTLAARKSCKIADDVYQELLEEVSKEARFLELYEYLSKHTNQTISTVLDVDTIYGILQAEQEAGLRLPEWTRSVFPGKMREPMMLSLALFAYNDTMKKFRAGPLLSEMSAHMTEAIRSGGGGVGGGARSLYVYSAHDVTLATLWRALGLPALLLPDYGASVALELHEDAAAGAHLLKVFYWNNTKTEVPTELHLESCGFPCRYRDFTTYLHTFLPSDWEKECRDSASLAKLQVIW